MNNLVNQGFNQGYKQPPIPFSPKTNYTGIHVLMVEIIVSAQKYSGEMKKNLDQMKGQHLAAVEKNQQLDVVMTSLKSEETYLRHENHQMQEFLHNNEGISINNLSNLIQPVDGISDQILDLITSVKASEDCMVLLEKKFSDGEIPFDEFLKLMKKIEEDKFDNKVLLAKCINSAQGY